MFDNVSGAGAYSEEGAFLSVGAYSRNMYNNLLIVYHLKFL